MVHIMFLMLEKIHNMKKVLLFVVFLLFFLEAKSQSVFSSLMETYTPMPAPVDKLYDARPNAKGVKETIRLPRNSIIPLQLYTNYQCSEFFMADYDDITQPLVLMMMDVPGTTQKLFSISVGGITEYAKILLVLVDKDGFVLDILEAQVCWGPPAMYAKQARIDKDFNITVYSIHTDNKKSLPIDKTIPSFSGWREDEVYQIINGKFVKKNTIRYRKCNFRYEDLLQDIWMGHALPEKDKNTRLRQVLF